MMKNLYHHTYLAGLLLAFCALFVAPPQTASAQTFDCNNIADSAGRVPEGLVAQCKGQALAAAPAEVAALAAAPTDRAFGQEAQSNTVVSFQLDTPEVYATEGPLAGTAFMGGCDFDSSDLNTLLCMDSNNVAFAFDITTGTPTTLGTVTGMPGGGETVTGIAFDPTTSNFYVTTTNITTSSLAIVDFGSLTATVVGGIAGSGCTIAAASTTGGMLYGYDICTDVLISIDKGTGAATTIGPLGFDANFGQGMDFDDQDGTCYLFAFNNGTFQPELRTCDTATGATTLVGVLGLTTPGTLTQIGGAGIATASGADLSVTKTTSDDSPQVGDEIDFTITVRNNGSDDATNVVVDDMLPFPLSLVSSSATQGSFAAGVWTIGSLLNGQSATLTITASVDDVSNAPVVNTATVSGDQADPEPTNDSASVTLFIQGADLSLDKDVSTFTPDLGDTFDYDITVCHNGGIPATGIRVTDKLPRGVTFVSSSGDYDLASGIYQFGDLVDGDCTTESITVRLNTTQEVTNRADISFSSAPDPDESDNADQVSVNGQAADLELEVHLVSFSQAGGTSFATFDGTLTNQGPSTVNAAAITIMVSPGATITGFSVPAGSGPYFGSTLTLVLIDPLPAGQSLTASVTVEAPANTPIILVAEVTDSDREDPDSTPGDGTGDDFDAGFAGVRDNPDFVRGLGPGGIIARGGQRFAADLSLAKTVDNASPAAGTDVVYTITVSNAGPQATTGVAVTDLLPGGLTFVSSTASQGSYDATTGVWDVGFVFVSGTATLEITATVTGSGTITNTATITGSNLPDPDDFFNFFDETPEQDDTDSASLTVQSASAKAGVVEGVELGAGYPNPFNPEAVIPFALGAPSQVRLAVYDMLGRQVALLVEGQVSAGSHEVLFSGASLPTGVYLVRLEAQGQGQTQRITLMK